MVGIFLFLGKFNNDYGIIPTKQKKKKHFFPILIFIGEVKKVPHFQRDPIIEKT